MPQKIKRVVVPEKIQIYMMAFDLKQKYGIDTITVPPTLKASEGFIKIHIGNAHLFPVTLQIVYVVDGETEIVFEGNDALDSSITRYKFGLWAIELRALWDAKNREREEEENAKWRPLGDVDAELVFPSNKPKKTDNVITKTIYDILESDSPVTTTLIIVAIFLISIALEQFYQVLRPLFF